MDTHDLRVNAFSYCFWSAQNKNCRYRWKRGVYAGRDRNDVLGIGEIGGPYSPGQIFRVNPRASGAPCIVIVVFLSREKARGKLMLSQYQPLVVGLLDLDMYFQKDGNL